jgi:hypothetical protein
MEAESTLPVVSPADLKAVFNLYRGLRLQFGERISVPPERVEAVCKPGADVMAVSARATFLRLLLALPPPLLSSWIKDGEPDMSLFHVAATFPFPAMTEPGIPHDFDLVGFMQQLSDCSSSVLPDQS